MRRADRKYVDAVLERVHERMYGIDNVLQLVLTALFSGGHVLLEGNPGVGKTALVKTLSNALGYDPEAMRWGRIQFTPDLMPADITGSLMPDKNDPRHLSFQRGPIFRWVLLADEINRATPKTQAAMLEAMGEHQVTVAGETHALRPGTTLTVDGEQLALRPPFMVLATQNPIDQEGTYVLPEAQSDRFMFKLSMPEFDRGTLTHILAKEAGTLATEVAPPPPDRRVNDLISEQRALMSHARIAREIRDLVPSMQVQEHICNLVQASNRTYRSHGERELSGLSAKQRKQATLLFDAYIRYGLSPRGAAALLLGAKGWSLLFGSEGGSDCHVGLARTALAAIRHRIGLRFDWDIDYAGSDELGSDERERLHDALLADMLLLTAPTDGGYQELLRHELTAAGVGPSRA